MGLQEETDPVVTPGCLAPRQRSALKGLANRLKPSVWIGKDGVSDAVLSKLDEQLTIHELVKVKILKTIELDRREVAGELARRARATVIQILGRTIVLFRRNEDNPRLDLDRREAGGSPGATPSAKPAVREQHRSALPGENPNGSSHRPAKRIPARPQFGNDPPARRSVTRSYRRRSH